MCCILKVCKAHCLLAVALYFYSMCDTSFSKKSKAFFLTFVNTFFAVYSFDFTPEFWEQVADTLLRWVCTQIWQRTCVSNTPWACLWGVTSVQESWNVIWGCGATQSCWSPARGWGMSVAGHISGIRNLDPSWYLVSFQILLEGERKKK